MTPDDLLTQPARPRTTPTEGAAPAPVGPSPWRGRAQTAAVALLLVAAAFFAYGQTLAGDYGFVNYDDNVYIYDNPRVQAGLTRDSIRWALTTTYTVNWYPLTWMSFMLDSTIWRGVQRPFAFHLTNLILHAADTALLFWVLARMTGRVGRSAFVAALFALHPLHVESVAWVTERKDVLSGLFWMLTMAAYAWYAERPHWARYLLVVFAFAIGLMAKSMLVTLPCVLLLLDFWPLRRTRFLRPHEPDDGGPGPVVRAPTVSWPLLVADKIPLLALSAASSWMTMHAQALGSEGNPIGGGAAVAVRVGNALTFYVLYIAKTIWPVGLVPLYPYPKEEEFSWLVAAMAGLLLAAVTVLALALARRRPYLIVGWLWFLGTLAPVIGVLKVIGGQGIGDRYTYIPLIGLFLMAVWGAADAAGRVGVRRWAAAAAGALLLVGLTAGTWQQVAYWHDSLALWRHTLQVNPNNYMAYHNIACVLFERGDIKGAEEHFAKAILYKPDWELAHYSLGLTYDREGWDDPGHRQWWQNAALAEYREAVRCNSGYAEAQFALGSALLRRNQAADALDPLESAVELDKSSEWPHSSYYADLGWALYQLGRIDEAVDRYRQALAIYPNYPLAHNRLGMALEARNDDDGAVAEYEEALRLAPDYGDAHRNLAAAFYRQGKVVEAARHRAEADRLGP
jgi:tetratricopeptide (TPR) repeat protein